jgi:hypothetical protein
MVKDSSQYSPVDSVDNNNDEKTFGDAERFHAEPRPESLFLRVWPMLSHGALVCASMLFFVLWMGTPSPYLHDDIPVYSPASVAVEPVIIRFNGTLDFPSIYRGPPTPELDAAWARIAQDVLPTRMSIKDFIKVGEVDSPSKVKYPAEFGGGLVASIESHHQLHCLNILRKVSWPEYYKPTDPSPEVARMHLDHCIEMIRQTIMCNADVTMITWDWVQGLKTPYPNFNTRHQCRNFQKILDWAVQAVHIPQSVLTRFEDTVDLPSPFHHDV